MKIIRSRIAGVGAYLPERILTNDDLAKIVDTTDAWIVERSGIRRRHIAAEGELTSDLATAAARQAMEAAGVTADEIDLIILGTTTPDDTFPASAAKVQANLGVPGGFAFDVQAVCSGFLYALSTADKFIRAGEVKTALVIGAETFSRILDWNDRETCVLFGDGAGAVVLRAAEGEGTIADTGILSTHLHSDGRFRDLLYVTGGPSRSPSVGVVRMEGKEVFRHAVAKLAAAVDEALSANGITADDLDWVVPHQANRRILASTAKKAGLREDRIVVTLDMHANTSAASIPLALDAAVKDGRIRPGHLILIEAMGGGFTWGSALIRM
ncbi:beta-ketoacyl-ACP synthase III [Oleispirillum naphthae]|uniref:beta-ketoacyl-ACP synthase III n=1 Tax=Oleispirillum naphthae TaxID=2838853 RepID=UPI00308250E0